MKSELTFAQSLLLMRIAERPSYVSDYYKPALKLVDGGFAEFKGSILHPTAKGMAMLDKARATTKDHA